jgi:hypothetical protein
MLFLWIDHHHFGYNTKLPEKTLSRKFPNAQWTKSKSKRKPQRRIPKNNGRPEDTYLPIKCATGQKLPLHFATKQGRLQVGCNLKRHSDNFKRHGPRSQQRLRHLRLARPHLSAKSCRK